jgi:pyrroline-5-carboxylate reductase
MDNSTGFVGGGRVARILLRGFSNAGAALRNVVVSDTNVEALDRLKSEFPDIKTVCCNNGQAAFRDIVFLAVHPQAIRDVLSEIRSHLKPTSKLVSLAPKYTIERLAAGLAGFDRIVRMIPNAPSIVNSGYNPIAFSPSLSEEDRQDILSLVGCLGQSPVVDEGDLEAYAVVTAMGPTYFWFQWAKLVELAVSFGLGRPEAEAGVASMLTGAVNAMFRSGMGASEVADLIPVKPLGVHEAAFTEAYQSILTALFRRLKE